MKGLKIGYWITTGLLSTMMLLSAYAYFTNEDVKMAFTHVGFPDFFRIELGAAKLIGAIVLLLPLAQRIKEWTYAGFAITFVSAFIAHVSVGDPTQAVVSPLIALALLITSYFLKYELNKSKIHAIA